MILSRLQNSGALISTHILSKDGYNSKTLRS